MAEYGSTTPQGVTFSSTNGNGWNNQSADWLKVLGSGIVGYGIGRWQEQNCNSGNSRNCGNSGGECSDNTYVTRAELKQSEAMAAKDAEIARLRSEKYADSVGLAVSTATREYVNRENDKQDKVTAGLLTSSVEQQTSIARLDCGLEKLAESTTREIEVLADAANVQFAAIKQAFKTQREISDCRYVPQPKVKICGTKYDIECADPAV